MYVFHGILNVAWHIVTIPFHLLATLIKIVIVGPLVTILLVAGLIVGCLAVVAPSVLSTAVSVIHIQPPDLIGIFTSQVLHAATPTPDGSASQVSSAIQEKVIVVSWTGNPDGAQWYEVLRKAVGETAWRRIAIMPAGNAADGHYAYTDADLQHGTTYLYAIAAVLNSGAEGAPVESAFQVVAP